MDKKLVKQTSSGVLWNYLERLLAQAINLVISIILARLIAPEYFGVISIATIMINFCNIFVTNGFANSLIQSKTADKPIFNAIFYYGFASSLILYALVFFLAPILADFYEFEILTPVLRIMALRIPIASLNAVQHADLVRRLEFKKFFLSTLASAIISAIVGVTMAYTGFGIWALAAQYLVSAVVDTVVLMFVCSWRPGIKVAWKESLGLLYFGFKMLAAALIKNVYSEISGLIVGKKFSVESLAYYSKGKQFPNIIVVNLNSSLSRVLFSAMSKFQDDRERIKSMLRRSLKINIFIVCPIMVGMFICSDSIIRILLTDAWIESIPYLQLFCIVFLLKSIHNVYYQAFNSIGNSGLTLRIELISTIFGVSALLVSVFVLQNIYMVVISICLECLLSIILCSFAARKQLSYLLREQLRDILPLLLISGLMGAVVWLVGLPISNLFIQLIVKIVVGIFVYVALSKLMKIDSLSYLINILKDMLLKKRGKSHDKKA